MAECLYLRMGSSEGNTLDMLLLLSTLYLSMDSSGNNTVAILLLLGKLN